MVAYQVILSANDDTPFFYRVRPTGEIRYDGVIASIFRGIFASADAGSRPPLSTGS